RRQRRGQRLDSAVVVRPVEQRHRRAFEHFETPPHDQRPRRRAHRLRIELASQEGARGAAGEREVAPLVAASRTKLNLYLSLILYQGGAPLGDDLPGDG